MPAFLLAVADAACPQRTAGVPEGLLKKLQPGKITGFLCLGDVAPSIVYALKRIATDFKRVAGNLDEERHLPQSMVRACAHTRISPGRAHKASQQGTIAYDWRPRELIALSRRHTTALLSTDRMRPAARTRRAHGHLTPRAQVFEQEGVTIGMAHGHLVMPAGDTNALEALRRRMAVDVLLTGATGKAQTLTTARGVLVNPGSITGAKMSPLASGCASYTLLVLDNGKVRSARDYRAM